MATLIHQSLREGLKKSEVQDLLLISAATGVIASVAGYWAMSEAKGEMRMPTQKAIMKAAAVGLGGMVASWAFESYVIGSKERA
jgi:hypothetical protein